jgi:carboxyl-terminal processing protease
VLRSGFSEIRDKGLVEHSLGDLFLAGLTSIDHIDPALHITTVDGYVLLTHADDPAARIKRPADDDMQGWIKATTAMFDYARRMSPLAALADREMLYQFMFEGALAKIDSYSRYSGARNARNNRAARNGFVGVGIDYDMVPGGAIVRSLTPNGPAAQSGLKVDDMISSADNRTLVGVTRDAARRLLSGAPDSVVRLSVSRPGDDRMLLFPVKRSLIVPRTVESQIENGVLFIVVRSFNIRTSADVSTAVTAAKSEVGGKLAGVVLDLRSDPGGLLDQAIDLSDLFLEGGTIATLAGRHPGAHQFYAARPGDIADGSPMVVLVDGKSASSAEITAAALADNARALIVGTNTLGKGSVQTLIRLPNDGEIALTWSEVVSPGGYKLHGLGLMPTICTSDYAGSLSTILESVYRRDTPWRTSAEAWRTVEAGTDSAKKMRALCPGQPRRDATIDQALALRVAADRALYAQASSASLASSR